MAVIPEALKLESILLRRCATWIPASAEWRLFTSSSTLWLLFLCGVLFSGFREKGK